MPEFTDKYHPRVKRDLRKIDKSVESEVKDLHIPRILYDPYLADDLTGDLAGIRSYHFKKGKVEYRISYIVDKEQKLVHILMIGKRESFYEILRRRL